MNTKRILIVGATIAILVLAGFGIYRLTTSGAESDPSISQPKEVAAKFVVAMTTSELAQAYDYGSAFYKAKNTPESIEKFSDTIRSDDAKISGEELYKGVNDASDKAIYLALVDNLPPSSTGITSANFIVRLVNEDGGWKVDSLEVR
jgi:hypothetical protein